MTKKIFTLITIFALSLKAPISFAQSPQQLHSPKQIKALYINHLTQFVSLEQKQRVITVCAVGDAILRAKLIQTSKQFELEHELNIKDKNLLSSFDDCNVLYISKNSAFEIEQILYKTSNHSILTVSDVPNFILKGGGIGFVESEKSIGIEINNTLLKEKNIRASSELLKIAKKVI